MRLNAKNYRNFLTRTQAQHGNEFFFAFVMLGNNIVNINESRRKPIETHRKSKSPCEHFN